MLDHPSSGRHYACTTSQIKEGECINKSSKSGATVKVCSCHTENYCNSKLWPITDNNISEESMTTNPRRQINRLNEQPSGSPILSSSLSFLVYSFMFLFFSLSVMC